MCWRILKSGALRGDILQGFLIRRFAVGVASQKPLADLLVVIIERGLPECC